MYSNQCFRHISHVCCIHNCKLYHFLLTIKHGRIQKKPVLSHPKNRQYAKLKLGKMTFVVTNLELVSLYYYCPKSKPFNLLSFLSDVQL